MSALTTIGRTDFSLANARGLKLFRVNAGIPVEDALEIASQLQEHVNQLIRDAAMNDQGERFSWPALYLGEMAKALLDDVTHTLFVPRANT
ncbi:DUF3077 domain-containing protein [Pseudomonas sp. B2M1-30]|uniref:DUF3077 domain-containing protein n=1 Tax=Pseudomonas TaxID=286 RepID=UPI0021C99468|nr:MULTISPECIES: DUF3077 domain-containing protein [Pseudomonas]MCU0118574.1 DUF3077 domain-containing protein [Pseudomonas sp. B2M1-30]MCU7263158.1 DUF3077 domain-containing protein [Pseudomonas koreensis]